MYQIKCIHLIHIYAIFDRAMHYGIMGFLIAKDILHLILPDSKKTEMKPTFRFCEVIYFLHKSLLH